MQIKEKNGELAIVDFDELEAYKIARKIESDGMDFYHRLQEKTDDEKLRKVLSFLIKKEREHLQFFEERLFKMREEKEESFEENDLFGAMDYGVFQPYQSMDDLDKALNNVKKAFKLAVIIEDHSIKFYNLCKDRVTSRGAKEEITKIIGEEKKHKKLFEELMAKESV